MRVRGHQQANEAFQAPLIVTGLCCICCARTCVCWSANEAHQKNIIINQGLRHQLDKALIPTATLSSNTSAELETS